MNKIQCVTFPRSGHHLIVNLLSQYYLLNAKKNKKNIQPIVEGTIANMVSGQIPPFYYCEYYYHCRVRGCKDERTNFQKDHDFKLSTVFEKDYKYVIQYRHPLPSLISFFKLKNRLKNKPLIKEDWLNFLDENLDYWIAFIEKWVLSNKQIDLMIPYQSLLNNPVSVLTQLISLQIADNSDISKDIIHQVLSKNKIRIQNKVEDFPFYGIPETNNLLCKSDMIVKELGLLIQ